MKVQHLKHNLFHNIVDQNQLTPHYVIFPVILTSSRMRALEPPCWDASVGFFRNLSPVKGTPTRSLSKSFTDTNVKELLTVSFTTWLLSRWRSDWKELFRKHL